MTGTIAARIACNKNVGPDLRRRLEKRHPGGSRIREALDRLSDNELVEMYFRHEQQGRAHSAKKQAEKGASS